VPIWFMWETQDLAITTHNGKALQARDNKNNGAEK
jgi:hypothetical protein